MLPYMIETIPDDDEENVRYENNLSEEEARYFCLTIKDSLCEMPYACGMLFQNFVEKSDYSEAAGYRPGAEDLPDQIEERIISL